MDSSRTFTTADDAHLIALLRAARTRLVFAAPGVSVAFGQALAAVIKSQSVPKQLSVILDVDPEVCRLGYGTVEGLEAVQHALESRQLRLQSAEGLRVGLLISDDETLIFSPTPLLIEAGSTAPSKPNAILLHPNPTDSLAAACGASAKPEDIEIGRDFVSDKRLAEVKADLKANPPKQFNLARLERVFNYELQFVEFKVEGYRLGQKLLPLDAEWLGLSDRELKDRFRSTFHLFDSSEPLVVELPKLDADGKPVEGKTEKVSEKTFTTAALKLRRELIPLGAYGSVILKRKRAEFETKVESLKARFESYYKKVNEVVIGEIDEVCKRLVNDLAPGLVKKPPKAWLDRTLDGKVDEKRIKALLSEKIEIALSHIQKDFKPVVTLIFKDVTYGTIVNDPEFRKKLEAYFGADEVTRLFQQWEAARASSLQLAAKHVARMDDPITHNDDL